MLSIAFIPKSSRLTDKLQVVTSHHITSAGILQ